MNEFITNLEVSVVRIGSAIALTIFVYKWIRNEWRK
jgi:hypothetical protein